MKKFLSLLYLLSGAFYGHSQINNSLLFSADSDSLIDKKAKFGFLVDNVNYVRNTEYHSEIEHGATWAGTQIWPQIVFRYNEHLIFKGGVFLQKDFGNNKFRTPLPTYTLTYTRNRLKVNFGTLDGSLDHKLIEPLYAMENYIDKRMENGFQVKGNFRYLGFDTWVDWEKMIYRDSRSPEKFTAGLSADLKLINKPRVSWTFPVQTLIKHQGGEIYAPPHSNIKTQFNLACGTRFTRKMPGRVIDKVDFQGFLTFYEDLAPTKADSFFDGSGQFVALTLYHQYFGVMLNYWDAHQYIAPLGEPLFVSKSRAEEGVYRQYQKMVMLRLTYEMPLWKNCALVARMNNIYNLSEKKYDNVIEAYFKFNIGSPLRIFAKQ